MGLLRHVYVLVVLRPTQVLLPLVLPARGYLHTNRATSYLQKLYFAHTHMLPSTPHTPLILLQVLPRCPELSVECGSNRVQLWTCLDSCVALRDLLVYLAANSDLCPPETAPPPSLARDYSSLGSDLSSISSLVGPPYHTPIDSELILPPPQNSHSGSPPLGSLANGDIGELISEAMEDVSHHEGPVSTARERRRRGGRSRVQRRGTEGARSKLQVREWNLRVQFL